PRLVHLAAPDRRRLQGRGLRDHPRLLLTAGTAPMSRPGGDSSDEVLAAAANAGDRGALEVLLARHLDRVHGICRRVTGHPEDALDATQEALIAVTRRLHRYDGRARYTTWLYRVA